ncbi:MAG: hypothetical protein AB1801_07610 [Chloroflexota bacterium]
MERITALISKLVYPVYFFVMIPFFVVVMILVDWYSGNRLIPYLSGLLTPVIAVVTAYIAYRQYKNDNERLKRDLYEKRYGIYSNLMETIALVVQEANVDMKTLINFKKSTREAYFLFGDDISSYLDEIYQKGLKLQTINKVLDGNLPVGEKRNQLADQDADLMTWFAAQFDVARVKFSRYLSLE